MKADPDCLSPDLQKPQRQILRLGRGGRGVVQPHSAATQPTSRPTSQSRPTPALHPPTHRRRDSSPAPVSTPDQPHYPHAKHTLRTHARGLSERFHVQPPARLAFPVSASVSASMAVCWLVGRFGGWVTGWLAQARSPIELTAGRPCFVTSTKAQKTRESSTQWGYVNNCSFRFRSQ